MDFNAHMLNILGLKPLAHVNISDSRAVIRLLQIPYLGLYFVDVTQKFNKHPDDAPDLTRDFFFAQKRLIKQVTEAVGLEENGHPKWIPILYNWEIFPGASEQMAERRGHLVFTTGACKEFLIVNVYGATSDYRGDSLISLYNHAIAIQQQQFLNLVAYLAPNGPPKWSVRSTYVTDAHPAIRPEFFDFSRTSPPSGGLLPPILHLEAANMRPLLSELDLVMINKLIAEVQSLPPAGHSGVLAVLPKTSPCQGCGGATATRYLCDGCLHCFDMSELSRCKQCRSVYYHSTVCQTKHWDTHKTFCNHMRVPNLTQAPATA